jgi:uncharacterized protein (DUF924 family)
MGLLRLIDRRALPRHQRGSEAIERRTMQAAQVIEFWVNAGKAQWFGHSPAFDAQIREGFEAAHHAAARSEFKDWEQSAEGALALLLLLDQFPRNLYRGSAHAFATDPLARGVAERAIAAGHDQAHPSELRGFFYLPFEHSEAMADQDRSVSLFQQDAASGGPQDYLDYAVLHRDIIARFGRFPHRNACLGRASTPEEEAFLAGGGFAG